MKKLSIEEMNRLSVDIFKQTLKKPLVVILDNIRSQHNIGAVFRTADAFLIERIYLCGITATPPNREIHKSALGATESVEWAYVPETIDIVTSLKQESYTIVALEQAHGSTKIDNFVVDKHEKIALIIGNEVNGVSDSIMDVIDLCLEIPQYGTKHSLNVSVSAGIAMYILSCQY